MRSWNQHLVNANIKWLLPLLLSWRAYSTFLPKASHCFLSVVSHAISSEMRELITSASFKVSLCWTPSSLPSKCKCIEVSLGEGGGRQVMHRSAVRHVLSRFLFLLLGVSKKHTCLCCYFTFCSPLSPWYFDFIHHFSMEINYQYSLLLNPVASGLF